MQGIGHELHDDHRQKGQNAQGAADPEAGNEHFHDQQHQTDNEAYDAGHGQAAQKAQKVHGIPPLLRNCFYDYIIQKTGRIARYTEVNSICGAGIGEKDLKAFFLRRGRQNAILIQYK